MPLKLIPPGRRKGNRGFLVRGPVGNRRLEIATGTRDRALAESFQAELERKYRHRDSAPDAATLTYAAADAAYRAWRRPAKADVKRLDKIRGELGARLARGLTQADLVAAANILHPGAAPATLNREVMRPAAAVLHYASGLGVPWLRIALFKEPRPRTRAADPAAVAALLDHLRREAAGAPTPFRRRLAHERWLLLLWLDRQGTRLGDTLRVAWPDLDLVRRTVRLRIGKTDRWREKPLDDAVWTALANLPAAVSDRRGRLFRWHRPNGVQRWLRPLCRRLGVTFTAHMARHALGKALNDSGAGLRTIMEALDHADPKSSLRYQAGDVEVVRAALRRARSPAATTGNDGATAGEKRGKATAND